MPVTTISTEEEKKSSFCSSCKHTYGKCGHYVKVEQYEVSYANGSPAGRGARRYCEGYELKRVDRPN